LLAVLGWKKFSAKVCQQKVASLKTGALPLCDGGLLRSPLAGFQVNAVSCHDGGSILILRKTYFKPCYSENLYILFSYIL